MGRWLDLLLVRSKSQRVSRQRARESAKRDSDAQAEQRERQEHYREVTKSDERGRDTSGSARPSKTPRA